MFLTSHIKFTRGYNFTLLIYNTCVIYDQIKKIASAKKRENEEEKEAEEDDPQDNVGKEQMVKNFVVHPCMTVCSLKKTGIVRN